MGEVSSLEDDLEKIAAQERELQFPRFDTDAAWKLGMRLRELAVACNFAVAVDVRRFGQPLFFSALEGSTPDNAAWVQRKSNVVERFHRSSYGVGLSLLQKKTTLQEKFALDAAQYAAHGGSFPIRISGSGAVGSATVSGLPQRADHELVVEAICLELGLDYGRLALSVNR